MERPTTETPFSESVSTKLHRVAQRVASPSSEEPDAGNPHVRICGGPGRATAQAYPANDVFVIDRVRCKQSRRRPVNAGGERRAELNVGSELKEGVPCFSSTAELSHQDAPGGVEEELADVRHPLRTEQTEKKNGFVFHG